MSSVISSSQSQADIATSPGAVSPEADLRWTSACEMLLLASPFEYQGAIDRALHNFRNGGAGLRAWASAIAWRGARVPDHVPAELIEVYLTDPEAAPLHDCEDCGIAIPVRPHRIYGLEGEPEHVYFPDCPVCGGATGWFLYWSRQPQETDGSVDSLRRRKPR